MAEQHDDALLLRSIPYRDSSLILHCLTAKHGRISLMARGARRAKSPFRAGLMPLYHLQIRWKAARTSSMGTLLEVQRLSALVAEQHMLDGQRLLAIANTLFPDGVHHGFAELVQACRMLEARQAEAGFCAAAWHMLQAAGWTGSLSHCWQCDAHITDNDHAYWRQGLVLCKQCANQHGAILHAGFRKSMTALLQQTNVRLPFADMRLWQHMIDDVLKHHHHSHHDA